MGSKYFICFTRNGTCDYGFDRRTNNIFKALWWLVTLSFKYPIIDFKIRRGYVPCQKCDADWCDKSPTYKALGGKEDE